VQAIALSSLLDSKLFYGSLRLCLVIINNLISNVQKIDLKQHFMRLYLRSIGFLEDSKNKFIELTNFYSEDSHDISFGENNTVYYPVDYLRLFNKKSEQELFIFTQKYMNDDIFTRRVYILQELYMAKKVFNLFMFELLEGLSEQAKEKIALGLGQEGIDVMDVRIDAKFIKKQVEETINKEIIQKHFKIETLHNLDDIDVQGEEIIYALLQTEENVISLFFDLIQSFNNASPNYSFL
jgi:hypothetical protein